MEPNVSKQDAAPARAWGYIPTLDGWRAIAVLLVIFDHTVHQSYCLGRTTGLMCGGGYGGHGVAMFFGLSGLLITLRLLEERDARGRFSLRDFYIRRAFRILPPALAFLVVLAVLHFVIDLPLGRPDWFGALLFARDLVPIRDYQWYTVHFWSLAVEEKFYFLWPALLAGMLALASRRAAVALTVALAVAVDLWRRLDSRHLWVEHLTGQPAYQLWYRFDGRADGLLWGCALALVLSRRSWRDRFMQVCSSPVAVALLAIWLILWKRGAGGIPEILIVPVLIAFTALNSGSVLGRLLESPIFRWVGRCSYSLYLWQELYLVRPEESHGLLQDFPLNIGMIFITAWASYTFLEKPCIKWGHRIARPVTAGRGDIGGEPARGQAGLTSTADSGAPDGTARPNPGPSV